MGSELPPLRPTIRIAVASGKGGTGKTTIATNLAFAVAQNRPGVTYVDCDVEEPNGHLFLAPSILRTHPVSISVPEIDAQKCNLCGACTRACRYSALVALPQEILRFPKLCHGCGGCLLACPQGAIRETPRVTGCVEEGEAGGLRFLQGVLDVGEAMAPPVVRNTIEMTRNDSIVIIDSPPGTSCPVIESVRTADAVLLVTEPTPFGLNDLRLAVQMVRSLGIPCGVVLNRAEGSKDDPVSEFCATEQVPLLLRIKEERRIAHCGSEGNLIVAVLPEYSSIFLELFERLQELVGKAPGKAVPLDSEWNSQATAAAPLPSTLLGLGRKRQVDELVVVSGKGGTGKTSITASFFALSGEAVLTDCDVDAADLHLLFEPSRERCWDFSSGQIAFADTIACVDSGTCRLNCRFEAIQPGPVIDPIACEGCGVCVDHCSASALTMRSVKNGQWFVSQTRHGPMIHGQLGIAQENSGKLVSLLRREARAVSGQTHRSLVISDGSPGIGCPVIASITGATFVLIVTEPTVSGLHDLERIWSLCRQFQVKAGVCINKCDINESLSAHIEERARQWSVPFLGRVRYDSAVTTAQLQSRAVVELPPSLAASDIRALWKNVQEHLTPCSSQQATTQ